MIDAFANAGAFLVSAIFNIYLFVLAIRFVLALAQANYFNQVTQVIIKLTQPIVKPVRRILPTLRGIEFATLFWMIIFEMLKLTLIAVIITGLLPSVLSVLITSFIETLVLILNTYFYAILLQAILSWVQPGYSPVGEILLQITTPILRPFRRLIPPVAGVDISPIPALLLLQFIIILIKGW